MKILLKEQVENYRYTVAKAVFLETYEEYELVEDIVDSNCMQVYEKETGVICIISIFGKPTINVYDDLHIHIYYQKKRFEESNKTDYRFKIYQLNEVYNVLYERFIEIAFTNTKLFLSEISLKTLNYLTIISQNHVIK